MTLATGGSASFATSTRSRFLEYANSSASFVSLIPICSPSGPTSLTRGTRICSLIRSCWTPGRVLSSGRRRGLKGLSPSRVDPPLSLKRHCMQRRHSLVRFDSVEPRAAHGRRGEGRCRSCFAGTERSRRVPASHCADSGARIFCGNAREQLVERQGGHSLAPARTDGDRVARLAVTPDDDVRDLRELGVPDPLSEPLLARVAAPPHGALPA